MTLAPHDPPPDARERAIGNVAVVGAGISGLAAARTLSDHGAAVRVFERARGAGGRAAHRRTDAHRFDHGAQYFTARDPRFVRRVESWVAADVVAPWDARIVALDDGGRVTHPHALARYVGTPGMNAVAHDLSDGLTVQFECTVQRLTEDGDRWRVRTSDGQEAGPFDAVVLALPPEQALRIDPIAARVDPASLPRSQPCWALMVAFDEPLPVDFDGAFVNAGHLSWAARDSSKPGRPTGERWTVHAAPEWSAARLDADRDDIARAMLQTFFRTLDLAPRRPTYSSAHRWALARPNRESSVGCVWLDAARIALCGDWCLGGRVEGAYLSGLAAADRIAVAISDRR